MLCVVSFEDQGLHHGFRYIISGQLSPDLLLHMLRLAGMEAAHTDGIFQLAEGGFDAPNADIL